MTTFLAPPEDMHPDRLREAHNREFWGKIRLPNEADIACLNDMYNYWIKDSAVALPSRFFDLTLFGVAHWFDASGNFIAFRNTATGVEPFLLIQDHRYTFSPDETHWLCAAALECAVTGLPKVVKGMQFQKVILIPHHEYDEKSVRLHGVITLIQRDIRSEITSYKWLNALYGAATSFRLLHLAQMHNKIGPYDVQTVCERGPQDLQSWKDAVPWFLTRDQVDEKLEQLVVKGRTVEEWHEFLANAVFDLGYPDPDHLHPKRLYHKLKKASNAKPLLELTQNAQHTATSLSTSVISQTWLETLQNVLGGMNTIIPDSTQVIFMGCEGGGRFKASHNLKTTLDKAEMDALEMVAQWASIHGQSIHDTPKDQRILFSHLRKVLETDAAIVAIPVYAWRALVTCDWPELHGVFVAIRRPSAPIPDSMTFTAWTLAAQYFLSPLAAAYETGKAQHWAVIPGYTTRQEGESVLKED